MTRALPPQSRRWRRAAWLAVLVAIGPACRRDPGPPEDAVRAFLRAMVAEDCRALHRLAPPGEVPPGDEFVPGCERMFREDPRAPQKKADLASYRFVLEREPAKDGKAVVTMRPEGLEARFASRLGLILADGTWRLEGVFSDRDIGDEAAGGTAPGTAAPDTAPRLDATEVTAADFARCVQAGACPRGLYVEATERAGCNLGAPGRESHPMNCVSWWGANRFCEWAGGRLPTGREWEAAARGPEGRRYPWGEAAPDCRRAVMAGCGASPPGTQPVATHPEGDTPEGLSDLAGNVDEWTSTTNGMGTELRGGAFDGDEARLDPARRRVLGVPYRLDVLGFRCAR